MTAIQTLRFLHLLAYLVIVGQLMYYVFVMGDALKMVSMENFLEQRRIVDPMVHKRHVPFYYLALVLTIGMLMLSYKQWNQPLFISVVVAFICLVADILLGLSESGKINSIVNTRSFSDAAINWQQLRTQWIDLIKIRGVISMLGFTGLLAALVFQR
jgi:hypothetical protein